MKLHIQNAESIGDFLAYQQTLSEVIEATLEFSRLTDEKSPEYRHLSMASEAAWDALTSTIDAYIARRIVQVLQKV